MKPAAKTHAKSKAKAKARATCKVTPKPKRKGTKQNSKDERKEKPAAKKERNEQSFARRWRPDNERGSREWEVLRDVFDAYIRPALQFPSKAEDMLESVSLLLYVLNNTCCSCLAALYV